MSLAWRLSLWHLFTCVSNTVSGILSVSKPKKKHIRVKFGLYKAVVQNWDQLILRNQIYQHQTVNMKINLQTAHMKYLLRLISSVVVTYELHRGDLHIEYSVDIVLH